LPKSLRFAQAQNERSRQFHRAAPGTVAAIEVRLQTQQFKRTENDIAHGTAKMLLESRRTTQLGN